MLTIKQITENTDAVIRGLEKKHFKGAKETIAQVIEVNDKRRNTQNQLDKNLAEVNSLSKTIGQLMKEGKKEEAEVAKARVAEIKESNKTLQADMDQAANDMLNLLYTIPNIPYDSVPEGVGAEDNVVEKMGGMETQLPTDALPHWELAKKYGCVQVIEELVENEALRPRWKQLVANLERGDEIVVAKFSNALRGSRELSAFIELCRIKVVRIISIHDRIDSRGKLFPETTAADVLEMFGALPEEVAVLRYSSAHVMNLQQKAKVPKKTMKAMDKADRENTIVDMYVNGHSFEDIMAVSGYNSRSSVFSVLNKHGVELNRGKFKGPLGKRKPKDGQ